MIKLWYIMVSNETNIYCIVNNFLVILNLGISYLIFFQSQPIWKFYKYFFLKSKKKKEKKSQINIILMFTIRKLKIQEKINRNFN